MKPALFATIIILILFEITDCEGESDYERYKREYEQEHYMM
jgi:hypothetical protein